MSKSMVNFTKGIVAGVIVGTTVGMVVNNLAKPRPLIGRKMKKNAGKIIGAVVSNVTDMMK